MKRIAVLLLVALLLTTVSCGPSPAPTPTPAEVAQQAATKMIAVNSFHFVIAVSGKAAFLDANKTMTLKTAEGDLVKPDRARAIAKVSTMGMSTEIGIISIGAQQYATNPLNQKWQEVPAEARWDLDLARLFDTAQGIPAVLQGTSWTFGSQDAASYVLQGQMPYAQLRALGFGLITSGEVAVEFQIGRSDSYVKRIQIVELQSDPQEPTTWVITLSAIDQPVDIQAPPLQ
jgi:hypothetical protein